MKHGPPASNLFDARSPGTRRRATALRGASRPGVLSPSGRRRAGAGNAHLLLGHRCGDRLLQTVARRLKRSVREVDTVARLGGDEFAVILEQLSKPRDAAATAKKLLHALARPFLLEGHKAKISASIGITVYPVDGDDVETLLKRADGAMYRAKAGRRNDYRFA